MKIFLYTMKTIPFQKSSNSAKDIEIFYLHEFEIFNN